MLEGVSKEKPRLLVVASTFPAQRGDGTPEFVGDLAAELVPKIDVRIIVPQVSGARSSEIYRGAKVSRFRYFPRRWEDLADGAVLENIRSKPSRLLQVVPFLVCEWLAVRKAVKQFDPDIIHAHWIIPQGLVVRLASRRPILLTTLGGDLYALDRFPINKLMRWIIRGAAAVTVMNTDMKERVLGLGAAASDVQVIPMGANLTGMTSRVPSTNPAMVRLLFVGRLVPKKGLTFLLDALRQLPSGLQWKLIVVGDGPLRNELENDAQGLSVEFVGVQSRSELRRTYANSDILITPSVPADSGDQDGLPVAMLEAMCAGLPVVASQLPGIDEVVVDGHNGILVCPGDSREISLALLRLIESQDTRIQLGKNAKQVADAHSTGAMGRTYKNLIEKILSR